MNSPGGGEKINEITSISVSELGGSREKVRAGPSSGAPDLTTARSDISSSKIPTYQ